MTFATDRIKSDYALLSTPGNIEFYDRCEITTIFLHDKKTKTDTNFYTLIVFEEAEIPASRSTFLTPRLLEIDASKSIGIARYFKDLAWAQGLFSELLQNGKWSEHPLVVGALTAIPKQFVPVNSIDNIPLNSILKNGFAGCSYVLEFFDTRKSSLGSYGTDVGKIKELDEVVRKYVPLDLLFMRDRIGNVVFQFPVSLLSVTKTRLPDREGVKVKIGWHPKLTSVPEHQVISSISLDKEMLGFGTAAGSGDQYELRNGNCNWEESSLIFRPDIQLVLHSSRGFFLDAIHFHAGMSTTHAEERIFVAETGEGQQSVKRIPTALMEFSAGGGASDFITNINERVYEDERRRLQESLGFIQYRRETSGRSRALHDLRELIEKHSHRGAYLWDPFLTATDVMNTLYFSPHSDVPLKAIGSYKGNYQGLLAFPREIAKHEFELQLEAIEDDPLCEIVKKVYKYRWLRRIFQLQENRYQANQAEIASAKRAYWMRREREYLVSKSNNIGINLEFRLQFGHYGWAFHDRFLIFPLPEGKPRAWSLGTSVNSIGHHHHVFQELPNARLIQDAFDELWKTLDHSDCIVWKSK